MKKYTIIALLAATSSLANAQTTLWNGDDVDGKLWDDGAPQVVENPEKGGINPSARCLKFNMTDGSKVVKIPFRDWMKPSMGGSKRIALMIKKPTNENVQIEVSDPTDGSAGYWERVVAWYGGSGQWQRLVFDFSTNNAFDNPGLITITAQTGGVASAEDVYIDNVEILPATKANGALLGSIADGSLEGNVRLEGAWMKGSCMNADGEWRQVDYDDFAALAAKMNANATSVDMRGADVQNPYNAFYGANHNMLVYSDEAFADENVIANGKAARLKIEEAYSFNAPEGFRADAVELIRAIGQGYNSFVLPFDVEASELGAEALATYDSYTGTANAKVKFDNAQAVGANVPFVTVGAKESVNPVFEGKTIAATPQSLADGQFVGVYTAATPAAGLWGLNAEGRFQKGGSEATINAFHAYLELPSTVEAAAIEGGTAGIEDNMAQKNAKSAIYTINGTKLGINAVNGKPASNLQKGIYIINGKKVVVK